MSVFPPGETGTLYNAPPRSPLAFTAKAISLVFHPIFISTLGFLVLTWADEGLALTDGGSSMGLLQLLGIFATVMPITLVALMVGLGLIRNLTMPSRESRTVPMLTMFGYYLGLGILLRIKIPAAEVVSDYLLLLAGITALTVLINLRFKISGHGISIGCFAGLYTIAGALSGFYGMGLVLVATVLLGGVIGWARLYLDAHRPIEFYSGWAVGYAYGLMSGWYLLG